MYQLRQADLLEELAESLGDLQISLAIVSGWYVYFWTRYRIIMANLEVEDDSCRAVVALLQFLVILVRWQDHGPERAEVDQAIPDLLAV